MSTSISALPRQWSGAWLDLVAFVGGLAMAWFAGWNTTDLVWSLWLSSFVVGYALIVWSLTAPLREFGANVLRDENRGLAWIGVGVALSAGCFFGLAFFTVHFGGFHFVHSVFLAQFFPIRPEGREVHGFPGFSVYEEVVKRYWIFLPLAFLAERGGFVFNRPVASDTSVTSEAIARRQQASGNSGMMTPYKNVIRMHLLIFFFAAAHFAKLENFAVYAVVYAVYFFPWKLLRKTAGESAAE